MQLHPRAAERGSGAPPSSGAAAASTVDDDDKNGKDKTSANKKKDACAPCVCTGPCFLNTVLKYQMPLMLAVAIVIGYLWPTPGVWISKQGVPLASVFVVRVRACAPVRAWVAPARTVPLHQIEFRSVRPLHA